MYTLTLVWSLPLIFWVRLNQMETGPNGCQHAALFVSWWNLEGDPNPNALHSHHMILLFLSTSVVTLWKWWLLVGTYPLSNENPKIIRQYDHAKDSFWVNSVKLVSRFCVCLEKSCVERCGTPLTKHLRLLSLHCNAALRFWDRTPRKKLNAHVPLRLIVHERGSCHNHTTISSITGDDSCQYRCWMCLGHHTASAGDLGCPWWGPSCWSCPCWCQMICVTGAHELHSNYTYSNAEPLFPCWLFPPRRM